MWAKFGHTLSMPLILLEPSVGVYIKSTWTTTGSVSKRSSHANMAMMVDVGRKMRHIIEDESLQHMLASLSEHLRHSDPSPSPMGEEQAADTQRPSLSQHGCKQGEFSICSELLGLADDTDWNVRR